MNDKKITTWPTVTWAVRTCIRSICFTLACMILFSIVIFYFNISFLDMPTYYEEVKAHAGFAMRLGAIFGIIVSLIYGYIDYTVTKGNVRLVSMLRVLRIFEFAVLSTTILFYAGLIYGSFFGASTEEYQYGGGYGYEATGLIGAQIGMGIAILFTIIRAFFLYKKKTDIQKKDPHLTHIDSTYSLLLFFIGGLVISFTVGFFGLGVGSFIGGNYTLEANYTQLEGYESTGLLFAVLFSSLACGLFTAKYWKREGTKTKTSFALLGCLIGSMVAYVGVGYIANQLIWIAWTFPLISVLAVNVLFKNNKVLEIK